MLVFGHRGIPAYEPENTITSFRHAMKLNADGIELDVHICKSGEIVVIHDDEVDRTTNGKGRVADLTLAELKKLDAGNGEKIPTLTEVLAEINHKGTIFIEVKYPGDAEKVALFITGQVNKNDWEYKNLPVISFYPEALKVVAGIDTKIRLGANFSSHGEDKAQGRFKFNKNYWRENVRAIIDSVKLFSINPCIADLTPEMVELGRENGLAIYSWTVNKKEEMQKALDLGIDGIMSDNIEQIYKYVGIR